MPLIDVHTHILSTYYDTVCYDAQALLLAYKLAGARQLLYGSDYPHNIGDMPGCAARIDALPVGEPVKEMIRSGNARRIFRLAS
ncbi:MAG: amidohydrolase family protein [Candidatus Rokubacteria bacterium]|nr:amidohydrolase family protein [Candidatus Rokubacteria bacterium]